jgi:hypothetical protein
MQRRVVLKEDAMAKAKAGKMKHKAVKRGKSLESVKPLTTASVPTSTTPTESMTFNFTKIQTR